jgi:dimethylglycine dehydrogenase
MLLAERAKHRYMGLETEIIGPEEIKAMAPVTNTEGILGALYDPLDGHLDPSGHHPCLRPGRADGRGGNHLHTKVLETTRAPMAPGTW